MTELKVLHLNTFDIIGGAARAAYRIHTALRKNGIHSEMLVAYKVSEDPSVKVYPVGFQQRKLRYKRKLHRLQVTRNPTYHTCNLFPSGIHRAINRSRADIVHFHWIGNELISIAEVKKIKKPIVWTLHDMWAFCGAEHYDDINSPGRYKEEYTRSNRPAGHGGRIDIDAWTWRRKRKHWKDINFYFVMPSRWLAECLQESSLFALKKLSLIPYCLDLEVFRPMDKKQMREKFTLPQDKKLILFGADGGRENPLKGYHLLEQALEYLASKDGVTAFECVIFGGKTSVHNSTKGIPITEVGRINDDNKLAMLYSAADVFVIPSMMDNLPNTVMEAMSCGTPCVGIDIGGIPDMIEHQKNGFLASPFDTDKLAEGIRWIVAEPERYRNLCQSAREKVERCFTPEVVAAMYRTVYEQILQL